MDSEEQNASKMNQWLTEEYKRAKREFVYGLLVMVGGIATLFVIAIIITKWVSR